MTPPIETETDRIRREYERRDREIPADFYALSRPANLFSHHGQQRALLAALGRCGMIPLAGRRILDIGCGHGQWLGHFETLGGSPADFAAIELEPRRAALARERFPAAAIRLGDATRLPWGDESFDIVSQSTVCTSILDPAVRRAVATEMLRVLKPSGTIVWYDSWSTIRAIAMCGGSGAAKSSACFRTAESACGGSRWRLRWRGGSFPGVGRWPGCWSNSGC